MRETEKEAKAAKLRKETKASVKEEVSRSEPQAVLGQVSPSVPSPKQFPFEAPAPEHFFCTRRAVWGGWGLQRSWSTTSLEQLTLQTSLMALAIPDLHHWTASNGAEREALQFSSLSAGRGTHGASLGMDRAVAQDVAGRGMAASGREEEGGVVADCSHAASSGHPPVAIGPAQSEQVRAGAPRPVGLLLAWTSHAGLQLQGLGLGPLPCPCGTQLLSFAWQPSGEDSKDQAGDTPAAGGEGASKGQPLQNGLHPEGQGGKEVLAPPRKVLPPRRTVPEATPSKAPSPLPSPAAAAPKPAETPRPEAPEAAKPSCPEKSPKEPCSGSSPPAAAPTRSKGTQHRSKVSAEEGDAPKGKGPGSTEKEKGTSPSQEEPPAKARAKREPGLARKEPEKMKKDVGGGKKELGEVKKPVKTANKSEGLKEEPGGIQEKSADVAKDVGKVKEESGEGKEAPAEHKETDESADKEVTCPQTCWALGSGH